MPFDALSNGTAGAVGIAATVAWIKVMPMLIGKIKPNGNGDSALELKMQSVVERVGNNMIAPVLASLNRMEAAMTRMEIAQSNMNANISAILAADQARALAGHR